MSLHIFGQKRVISFNYVLKDSKGEVLDSSAEGPLAFLEGAGQIIPALEEELKLMSVGDKKNVKIKAAEAYGEYEDKMTMKVPKEELSHIEVEMGSFLQLNLGDSERVVKVVQITDQEITLDGNHPLAGVDLEFDVELMEARTATEAELSHGHAHGPGGHHNH